MDEEEAEKGKGEKVAGGPILFSTLPRGDRREEKETHEARRIRWEFPRTFNPCSAGFVPIRIVFASWNRFFIRCVIQIIKIKK